MVFRLSGRTRRSQVEIMYVILRVCLSGAACKTKIVYDANLNFTRLNKYLSTLLSLGFVELSIVYRGKNNPALNVLYKTSKAGVRFLNDCLNMQEMLGEVSGKRKVRVKPLR